MVLAITLSVLSAISSDTELFSEKVHWSTASYSIADDYYDGKISVVSSLGVGVQKAKQERHRELEHNASQY